MEIEKISERAERLNKLEQLKKEGINPYPAATARDHGIDEVLTDFTALEKTGKEIVIAGRLHSKREHGNLTFAHIDDGLGQIQLAFSKKEIGDKAYKTLVKYIDIGDFLETRGKCFTTHKGERSVMVSSWKILSKALRPLPEKRHGLQDGEEKLRKRYLDILSHHETGEMIKKRALFWQSVRNFMVSKGFLEVETPVLEVTTGGADARPFITHHNALDMDVYLRISMGELWQKRLMVAGFPKTFEIGRQFRNEGMDAEHLQDYTQMEFYWAYADYSKGMKLVEELFKHVAGKTFGTLEFHIRGFDVDLGQPWKKYDYRKTVKKFTGIDILDADLGQIESKLKELGIEYDKSGFNITRAIDNLWKYCRKQIAGPGFLVGVPVTVSPLAKRMDSAPELTERFQPIIAGSELGNGYSELNDPLDQAKRFAEQQKLREAGDEEAQMYDQEFVEALEYGMPPTCGFGMSERVFSFLTGKSARECQIFPLMRPKDKLSEKTVNPEKDARTEKGSADDLGLDYEQAVRLLDTTIHDPVIKMHMIESEAIMRALAGRFGEDEEKWAIIGLLHDIDWEETKDDIKNHTVKAVKILKDAGGSDFLISSVVSHAYGNDNCGEHPDRKRTTRLEHSLAAAETLTGLIIASALMQPDKKLASVKPSSLKKKFKQKSFAANCDRDIMKEIEETGLSLDEFLEIGLKALQAISDKLGL